MSGVGRMFLAFSVLEIGDPLVEKGSKERILDVTGRGCIYFNLSGFLS